MWGVGCVISRLCPWSAFKCRTLVTSSLDPTTTTPLDPNHNHANPTMEDDAPRYNPEFAMALKKDMQRLDITGFREKLDEYDKEKWLVIESTIESTGIPEPVKMQKEKQTKTGAKAQNLCLEYLNTLMRRLP